MRLTKRLIDLPHYGKTAASFVLCIMFMKDKIRDNKSLLNRQLINEMWFGVSKGLSEECLTKCL